MLPVDLKLTARNPLPESAQSKYFSSEAPSHFQPFLDPHIIEDGPRCRYGVGFPSCFELLSSMTVSLPRRWHLAALILIMVHGSFCLMSPKPKRGLHTSLV